MKIRLENWRTRVSCAEAHTLAAARKIAQAAESGGVEPPRAGIYNRSGKLLEVWSGKNRINCDIYLSGQMLQTDGLRIWPTGGKALNFGSPLYRAAHVAIGAGSLSSAAEEIGKMAGQDINNYGPAESAIFLSRWAEAMVALAQLEERPVSSRADESEILISEID